MFQNLGKTEKYGYLLFAIPALFFLLSPAKFPADDGFFYPQIAHNFVNGLGFKFNDIYPTNGFHPLWMVVCIISDFIIPIPKQEMIYILWLIQIILFFLSIKYLQPLFKDGGIGKIAGVGFLALVFFSVGTLYLTEAHLNLFCIALLLNLLIKGKSVNGWLLGLATSMVFLSRLDNAFVLIFLGLYCLSGDTRPKMGDLIKAAGVCIVLVGGYLLYNKFEFGNMVPISGRIKSSFPYAEGSVFGNLWGTIFLVSNVLYAILLSFVKVDFRKLKLYFIAGAVVQLLYNLYFQSQIGQWYFVMQMLAVAFMLNDIVNVCLRKFSIKQSSITIGVLLIGCTAFLSSVSYVKANTNMSLGYNAGGDNEEIREVKKDKVQSIAEDLKKNLPAGSRVFTYDMPGKLAFYSDLQIIPADGLVADKSFFGKITSLPFEKYLAENNIQYVLLPAGFQKKGTMTFIGIEAVNEKGTVSYRARSSFLKKNVSKIQITDFDLVTTFPNPLKVWQPDYDTVILLKLKKEQ
ncbi:hypothetical protein C1637_11715 [Chryseobacterium lactis]|uniref:Glycosyltransferase RgtA/B/C/D-like domain-containing protein n=1 Tax=Chryseobacterium lactis TaxID=1241981 RepID=A0A3G6RRZ0_CHRLC|nr:hypothetical protein [Chryseobacterium lactis]AZA80805.1 hypothetical protein EG342_02225 [Chryseobacterium lactis]AZB05807.1 hypothetical protein EG341_18350 [Chryseobacterium lactis]PNW13474.1 hypothetical protein C1637_11715 [Chryseobacterium lactis]